MKPIRVWVTASENMARVLAVQMATFGRLLSGTSDALRGLELVSLKIEDESVVAISGRVLHTMARYTGRESDVVSGAVFAVTTDAIRIADEYEVAALEQVAVVLQSGVRAWAYVDAGGGAPLEP